MASPLTVSCSRTVPFPVEETFAFTLPEPLPRLFRRWWGPIPPVVRVDGPEVWGTAGQVRTIHTGDGASMREELLVVEAPSRFTYELTELTGAFRFLAGSIDGTWSFDPVGTGTRVTWEWTIHPPSDVASYALPVLGMLWKGYARRSLDQLDELLAASLG